MGIAKSFFNLIILCVGAQAFAANQDMNTYTGNFTVKDCVYSENFVTYPKDYNCRFTEIRVTAQPNTVYQISYTDELGQKVDDIAMSDFTNKDDNATTQGAFTYSDQNVVWTLTKAQTNGATYTDTRTFTLNTDGTISYDHAITSSAGDSYKNADWVYTLVREKKP